MMNKVQARVKFFYQAFALNKVRFALENIKNKADDPTNVKIVLQYLIIFSWFSFTNSLTDAKCRFVLS